MDGNSMQCMGIIYKVQIGDTLYNISRKYGVRVLDVMKANPYVNVYNLQEGEEICIPTTEMEEYEPPMMSSIRDNMTDAARNMSGTNSMSNNRNDSATDLEMPVPPGGNVSNRMVSPIQRPTPWPTGPAVRPPVPPRPRPTGPAVEPLPTPELEPPVMPEPLPTPELEPPVMPEPLPTPELEPPTPPITLPENPGAPITGFRPYVVTANDTISTILDKTGLSFEELYRYNHNIGNISVPQGTILLVPVQIMPFD